MSVQVRPATPDRWSDLVTVFGRRGEDPSWCWCRLFLRPATGEASEPTDNRDALRREIWPLLGTRVKPVIDRTFPLAEAGQAHEFMAKTGHTGKILLKMA